jgi:hypothetical protein
LISNAWEKTLNILATNQGFLPNWGDANLDVEVVVIIG